MIEFTRHDDIQVVRPVIERCIANFGWAPEHNPDYFFHSFEADLTNAFFVTSEGWGVLAQISNDVWYLFAEPMAPGQVRAGIVREFCRLALMGGDTKKVVVELTAQTRRDLLKILGPEFRSRAIAETFLWPILSLVIHDPEYAGSAYKPLRNARNRFFRDHAVEVKSAQEISADALHDIVQRWERGRRASHESISEAYHALIDDQFRGTRGARVLVIDGRAEALSAGWKIPNSHTFYLAVSLHTYAHWGLGEAALMEDLKWLQEQGFYAVDLGGSDKKLFAFKKQFGAVTTYKTHQFSIVRN